MPVRLLWQTDPAVPAPDEYVRLREQYGDRIEKGLISIKALRADGLTNYQAERLSWWIRNGPPKHGSKPPVDDYADSRQAEPVDDHYLHSQRYIYEADRDVYVTFLRSSPKPLVMPGTKHRAIISAYSNWDGQPATLNQIARTFAIPRPWLVEYLRAHQITHDREPFSSEEVAARDVDEMVDDALQARRSVLHQKYETEKWKAIKADARKWSEFEESTLKPLLAHIEEHAPAYCVPQLRLPRSTAPFALVVGLTDFHWGSHCWVGETIEDYSRDIAEQRLIAATTSIMGRLPGQPEKIILPVGSDFFHVDGWMAQTTAGTPQDVDGTPSEILITGCEMTRIYIDLLRQVAPVEVVLMSGNHDRVAGLAVMLYLSAWYRNVDDVTVVQDYRPRVYSEYGATLIGFSHGDGAKPKELGAIMATEAREAWGRARHHVAFGGHLHHQVMADEGGITHYMMPSLAAPDRWHTKKGFTTASKGLCAYLIDRVEGVISTLFSSGECVKK